MPVRPELQTTADAYGISMDEIARNNENVTEAIQRHDNMNDIYAETLLRTGPNLVASTLDMYYEPLVIEPSINAVPVVNNQENDYVDPD
jgi:hypothetical protein